MMIQKTKKLIYNIVIIAILLGGIAVVLAKFLHLGNVEYTDNATVRQHITPINTRVQGFVAEIRFSDYQHVSKGDTLAIIDDSEFRLHLVRAEADYANALAGQKAANVGVVATKNNISVGDAGVEEAKAQLQNAERDFRRFEALLKQGAVTQQQYDNVNTAYLSAKARYEQVTRARQSTALVNDEQTVRLSQSEAAIRLANANVEIARLNLSYCVIIATADGFVGKKEINVGQLVQPGQNIVRIVDDNDKWVERDFQNVIFLVFTICGHFVVSELHSSKGRADTIVVNDKYVYLFEFKMDSDAQTALDQINEKDYAGRFKMDGRKLLKVGVNFSSKEKNITEWKVSE
ncbi:MAG: PD-(D/E)XK nuclease domain-containing protein [Bacteroidales bacterium]|nr:PD-(D/E)XK nuclease domain-containing protein [Bacteroidales bacterium]